MKIGIIDLCKQIEDPRMNRKKVHKMETIIYISIAAVICGAQSWNEIEEFGNAKIAFFKSRTSHVFAALGLPKRTLMGVLRVSFSPESTRADVDALAGGLTEIAKTRIAAR